ncbi:Cys-tRNA(Pro) deacylase, prolyl-tRNA editing enzyme YbaK/EbsC [Roseateles sp. YR242]|uniref:YbaK/EbsC family protein n=1 Tax=Roseateles sp. YR242 TaxID=1855305 RepID=UPI0008D00AD7|nr:YbaK/EbsC family protein [Roseateles sp. YR242]SEK53809.1 Cys-tRNA(Pro) deacylase, prolyl-tRNA editing enzyme YbaK/EbsC [Roseateles sp. YR242]
MSFAELAKRHHFDPVPAEQWPAHLPDFVARALPADGCLVFPVADEHSDTAQFSARFGFSLEDCANTLILRFTKEGVDRYAAVVTLGSRRLDINGAVKAALDARRLSFAKREIASELTGMEFGGVTAFGLPADMPILIDAAVMERACVVVGAGYRRTKILVPPSLLQALPQASVAALAFQEPVDAAPPSAP